MNTSVLKAFAPAVRRALQDAVSRKLDVVLAAQTPDFRTTFAPQVAALRTQATADRDELVERVAYTWFNRLAALRYLDARGWHPFNVRVLTPTDPTATQPELLKQMREGALPDALRRFTDPARLDALLDGQIPSAAPQTEVYRHLVLAACRYYHALLPNLFERLDDSTELLLPDDLLTEQSVVAGFRSAITDDDCADVEMLGWLYQFYISEKKAEIDARKTAVSAAEIPAKTQLFTPHWIVRYLVENSLGRLWLLNRPRSRLREHMPYFIESKAETDFLTINNPEEIRLCDPAVGSGHMLTYAFDLLSLIYEEEGYASSEIPALILQHNLHGIEICPRAAQLAELSLVLKAREKSRRFFHPEHLVRPRTIVLRDVRFAKNELDDYMHALRLRDFFNPPMLRLLHQFEDAENLGSLIQPCLNAAAIETARREIEKGDVEGQLLLRETHLKILRVLEQAEALARRYHVVVANPPYLSDKYFAQPLKAYSRELYKDSRFNLYSMFMSRAVLLLQNRGELGMITLHSWMSGSKYESLRERLVQHCPVVTMAHLGAAAFDSIGGQVVSATAFVLEAGRSMQLQGEYLNLTAESGEDTMAALVRDAASDPSATYRFTASGTTFSAVPGSPIVYWISKSELRAFATLGRLSEHADFRQGMATTDNETFLRRWTELPSREFVIGASSAGAENARGKKWFPYNKGGGDRRWYGHNDFALRYERNGDDLIDLVRSKYPRISDPEFVIKNRSYYFRPSVTYSALSGGAFAARLSDQGFIFDTKGSCAFPRGVVSREGDRSVVE